MDKSYGKVNDAIAKYNQEVDAGTKFFGSKANPLPKLMPLDPETANKVDEWKSALKKQFELEQQKENLDKRKTELDRIRDQLEREWKSLQDEIKPFDPANPRVVRLRERLKEYTADTEKYKALLADYTAMSRQLADVVTRLRGGGGSPNGPFRLYTGAYSNTADLKGGGSGTEFPSLAGAQAKARKHMSDNASKQPSYRIEDKDGKVIEAQGLFKNLKAPTEGGQGPAKSSVYYAYTINDEGKKLAGPFSKIDDANKWARDGWAVWSRAQENGVRYSGGLIREVGVQDANGRVLFKLP
jgi:hypothetical protein